MTAFAIDFRRDRATVQADSLAYMPDLHDVRPLGVSLNKVLTLPHLDAVLFGRGQMEIVVRAWVSLMLEPHISKTIEQAAARLTDILWNVTVDYADEHGFDPGGAAVLECALVGWSKAEQRMRLWQYMSTDEYQGQDDAGQCYGVLPFPRLPDRYMPKLPPKPSAKELSRIIFSAGRYFEAHPELACGARVGGEIVQHVLTPQGISSKVIHKFADFESMRVASAAIVNRIDDGRLDVSRVVANGLVAKSDVVDSQSGRKIYA